VADELTAGSTIFAAATENSMAAAIERHINALLVQPLPFENTPEARDRRRLFAGIARGIIEHLIANPLALEVVFTQVPGPEPVSAYKAHVEVKASDVP
jgi:hypothetical protein